MTDETCGCHADHDFESPDFLNATRCRYPAVVAERDRLRGIVNALKTGDCWCECGIDNPNMRGTHTVVCRTVRELLGGRA
jgi:hypothetical protein